MTMIKQLKDKNGNEFFPQTSKSAISDFSINASDIEDHSITRQKIASDFFDLVYPVGSIYMTATMSTVEEVESAFGGEWVAWGAGRVPVGVDPDDETFSVPEEFGGVKGYKLSSNAGAANSDAGSYGYITEGATTYQSSHAPSYLLHASFTGGGSWNHSTPVTINNSPSRETTNLQPYVTCYMYKRLA